MKYRDYITMYDNGCGNVEYYYKGKVVTDTIKIFQNILDAELEKDGFDICPDDIRLQILEKFIYDKKVLKARWNKLKKWCDDCCFDDVLCKIRELEQEEVDG